MTSQSARLTSKVSKSLTTKKSWTISTRLLVKTRWMISKLTQSSSFIRTIAGSLTGCKKHGMVWVMILPSLKFLTTARTMKQLNRSRMEPCSWTSNLTMICVTSLVAEKLSARWAILKTRSPSSSLPTAVKPYSTTAEQAIWFYYLLDLYFFRRLPGFLNLKEFRVIN